MLERRARLTLGLAGLVVTLTLVLVGRGSAGSGGPTDKPSSATRTSEGGEVTVAATWKGRSAGPVFEVAMDTHSVDLDGYDLKKLAVLRTGGGVELHPSAWTPRKAATTARERSPFPRELPTVVALSDLTRAG